MTVPFWRGNQHQEEIQSELISSKPLLWLWPWREQDLFISLRVREAGAKATGVSTCGQGGYERKDETQRKRQASGRRSRCGWRLVDRSQDDHDWSHQRGLQKHWDTQHETVNSYFPSPSQSNLINLDLTHSNFAIIPCHHRTISLSQHSKALLNLVQLYLTASSSTSSHEPSSHPQPVHFVNMSGSPSLLQGLAIVLPLPRTSLKIQPKCHSLGEYSPSPTADSWLSPLLCTPKPVYMPL